MYVAKNFSKASKANILCIALRYKLIKAQGHIYFMET